MRHNVYVTTASYLKHNGVVSLEKLEDSEWAWDWSFEHSTDFEATPFIMIKSSPMASFWEEREIPPSILAKVCALKLQGAPW